MTATMDPLTGPATPPSGPVSALRTLSRARPGRTVTCVCKRGHHKHGTRAMYLRCGAGCRCRECRDAVARLRHEARVRAHLRHGRSAWLPAEPTRQLLRGLVAFGYPLGDLARELGYAPGVLVPTVARPGTRRVSAVNARRVADLVERLGATPGPSQRARLFAARQGWTPDLLWPDRQPARPRKHDDVDDAVVVRAADGERLPLTVGERRAVIRRLHARGLSDVAIARVLGCAPRSVLRTRGEELHLPPNVEAVGLAMGRSA